MTQTKLNEGASPAAQQAKALGLEYGGFGGWIDPKTRQVKARTVDGRLVRVEEGEEGGQDDNLGRLVVIAFDDELLYADTENPTDQNVKKLVYLLKSVVRTDADVVIMHARNSEKEVAKWLKDHKITAGAALVPYGSSDPDKKHELVEKKIHAGYTEIQFFDSDPKALHAVEALKAPYNKRNIKIETHQIPKLPHDMKLRPQDKDTPQQ